MNDRGTIAAESSARRGELIAWIACLIALAFLYLIGASSSNDWFGINALGTLDAVRSGVVAAIGIALAIAFALWNPPWTARSRAGAAIAASASFPIFFLLRTNLLNGDGNMFTPKFAADVPRIGAHLTHDEILELFLHSRVWYYTNRWWGWSVVFSYQVVSCAAGVLFVYGLLRLAHRVAPERGWLFVCGAVSGAFLQLFFGDVENYTVTAALIVFYVIAAHDYLSGTVKLWVPTAILATAMCFHLETGWLLPSVLYLFLVERRKNASLSDAAAAATLAVAIGGGVLVYFHFHGLPIWRLHSSHAGEAARLQDVFAIGMPPQYYVDQLNLLLLLCPTVILAIPLLIWHRNTDKTTTFLVIAAASMLALQAIWKAQLGVRDDWNLYAIGGMLTGFAIWRAAARDATTFGLRLSAALIASLACIHTAAWIVANHWRTHW